MNQTGRLQSTMIGTNVKPQELIHFTNVLVKIIHLVSLTIFCTFLKRWMFSTIHKDWHKCINLFKMNSFLCQITFANLYIFENFEKKNDSKEHTESVGSMNFCLFGVGVFCNLANGANINLVFSILIWNTCKFLLVNGEHAGWWPLPQSWNKTWVFQHPVQSDTFPWSLGVSD